MGLKEEIFLIEHEAKNNQYGDKTVAKLNDTLEELNLLIKLVPTKVNVATVEVSQGHAPSSFSIVS